MATTSAATGGKKRYFSIGRTQFKDDGFPIWREYLGETAPTPDAKRVFEQRDKYHYEAFSTLSGVITNIYHKEKIISGQNQTMLMIDMIDGPEKYIIEVGNWDGRYATNIMQRLCNDTFNPKIESIISPYISTNDQTGKQYLGIMIRQLGEKIETRRSEPGFFEVPQATYEVKKTVTGPGKFTEKKEWDFSMQSQFYVDYLNQFVVPNLPGATMQQANAPVVQGASNAREVPGNDPNFPSTEGYTEPIAPPTNFDDLPF